MQGILGSPCVIACGVQWVQWALVQVVGYATVCVGKWDRGHCSNGGDPERVANTPLELMYPPLGLAQLPLGCAPLDIAQRTGVGNICVGFRVFQALEWHYGSSGGWVASVLCSIEKVWTTTGRGHRVL